jgi:hypothetical protein
VIRVMAQPSPHSSPDPASVAFAARPRVLARHERVALDVPGLVADLSADARWWALDLALDERVSTASVWAWLEAARGLPPQVKLAVRGAGARHLVVETPAGPGAGFDAWRLAARAGLAEAHAIVTGARAPREANAGVSPALSAEASEGLDWPATERADGSRGFDLGVTDATGQAIARLTPAGDVAVEVVLGRWSPETPQARDALALLLLLAGGATRMARPFGVTEGVEMLVGFDVQLAAPIRAAELEHALRALATAAEACAAEAQFVVREEVARAFVARWPGAVVAAPRVNP